MFRDAFNLNDTDLRNGLDTARERLARAHAQAETQSAMQSPDGFRFSPVPPNPSYEAVRQQVRAETLRSLQIPSRIFSIIVLLVGMLATSAAFAQCPNCGQFHPPYDRQPARQMVGGVVRAVASMFGANDALAEVNATRVRRGLPPFKHDPLLTRGAMAAASARAQRRLPGHTSNDFGYLPAGARARGAGCAAWVPSLGWGACYTYENYSYAGAAWAMGSDGKRYMHLFVR